MEPPIDFTADSVRNEKVKVLRSLHTPGPKHVVRGQYGRGFVEGVEVPGYREEEGVAPDSTDRDVRRGEALRRQLALGRHAVLRARWASGSRGARRRSRSSSSARRTRRSRRPPARGCGRTCCSIHIQPDEGVSLAIGAKVPGQGMTIRTVHMDFLYGGAFRDGLPEAYERLILDAMLGDATLFTRADEIEEQWALVDAIVAVLAARPAVVPELRGRHVGPAVGGRADPPRRPLVAAPLMATPSRGRATDVTIAEIERELARLRDAIGGRGRAAEPAHERDDAHRLGAAASGSSAAERDARRAWPSAIRRGRCCSCRGPTSADGIDAERLGALLPGRRPRGLRRGDRAARSAATRAAAPASIVAAAPDLRPAGLLPLARRAAVRRAPEFEQLVGVVDRLIVDSTEWERPARSRTAQLAELFERAAVSDIAWARTERWRVAARAAVAGDRGRAASSRVHGTRAQALPARRLAALAPRPRDRARDRRARAARGHRPRRQAGAVPAGRPAEPERRALRRARRASAATRSTRRRFARRRGDAWRYPLSLTRVRLVSDT